MINRREISMLVTKETRQTALVDHSVQFKIEEQYWQSLIESGLSEENALDEALCRGKAESVTFSTEMIDTSQIHETTISIDDELPSEQLEKKSEFLMVGFDDFCQRLDIKAYDGGAELGSSLELYESYLEIFKSQPNKKESSCDDCHSEHVEGGSVEIKTGQAHQKVSCTNCEAEWVDIYMLVARQKI
jgi:hypothetical protein